MWTFGTTVQGNSCLVYTQTDVLDQFIFTKDGNWYYCYAGYEDECNENGLDIYERVEKNNPDDFPKQALGLLDAISSIIHRANSVKIP